MFRRVRQLALGACLLLGLMVVSWIAYSRALYGIWDPLAQPSRIDYCDRRYYPGSPALHLTRSQIEASSNAFGSFPMRQVGMSPAGAAIYARPLSDSVRYQFANGPVLPCDMAVYLKVGTDDYVAYGISGGP